MEKFKGQTLPACCDFTTLPSGALQSPIQPSFGGNLKSSSPKLNFNSAFQISTKQSYRFKRPCEIVFHFTSSFPHEKPARQRGVCGDRECGVFSHPFTFSFPKSKACQTVCASFQFYKNIIFYSTSKYSYSYRYAETFMICSIRI